MEHTDLARERKIVAWRRFLLRFGLLTWVFPGLFYIALIICEAQLVDGGILPKHHEPYAEQAPFFVKAIFGVMSCLGCLSMIFCAMMAAKVIAVREEQNPSGRLRPIVRVLAGLCSAIAISVASLILSVERDRLDEESFKTLWKFIIAGILGLFYCVWSGVNPEAPDMH